MPFRHRCRLPYCRKHPLTEFRDWHDLGPASPTFGSGVFGHFRFRHRLGRSAEEFECLPAIVCRFRRSGRQQGQKPDLPSANGVARCLPSRYGEPTLFSMKFSLFQENGMTFLRRRARQFGGHPRRDKNWRYASSVAEQRHDGGPETTALFRDESGKRGRF